MQRRIIGLILICAGGLLFVHGWERKESLVGSLSQTESRLANHFDGGARTPKHTLYLATGALTIACGVILTFGSVSGKN